MKHKWQTNLIRVFVLLFILGLWQFSADYQFIDSFYFSSPKLLLLQFMKDMSERTILSHIGITLAESIISFLAILIFAVAIAAFFWFIPQVGIIMEPFFIVLNSLPKSALAPLIIVWLGTGMKPIILCGVSIGIFGSILHFYQAFSQTDPELVKLVYILGGNRWNVFTKIILPYNFPLILSMSKVNIGLALVGVMIGEFLVGRKGLGYLIIYASQTFQLTNMILSICILCALSGVLYVLLMFIEKIMLKKYQGNTGK